jgi:uncharacterized spore protein YtfJ
VVPVGKLDPGAQRALAVRKLLARLSGARICFSEPVRAGEHTIIGVARLTSAGGGGGGSGNAEGGDVGSGWGGGGFIEAKPVGYIHVGPQGAQFKRIRDMSSAVGVLRAAAAVVTAVAAATGGARALRDRSGPAGLLRRPARAGLPSPRRSRRR